MGWEQTGYMLHNGIRRQLGAYEIRLSPPNRMFIRLDREGWFDIIVLEFESKSPDVAIGYLRIECQLHVDPSDFYPMFPKIMDSILKRLRIRDHGVELEYIVLWPNPPRNTKLHPTKYLGQIEVYRGEELHP
ncbi:MAG TPA: hypothetical protein ENF47_04945 [Thermoprotei archaeon]|nr:hypothetical protein [Thermoprotei archaeon]